MHFIPSFHREWRWDQMKMLGEKERKCTPCQQNWISALLLQIFLLFTFTLLLLTHVIPTTLLCFSESTWENIPFHKDSLWRHVYWSCWVVMSLPCFMFNFFHWHTFCFLSLLASQLPPFTRDYLSLFTLETPDLTWIQLLCFFSADADADAETHFLELQWPTSLNNCLWFMRDTRKNYSSW